MPRSNIPSYNIKDVEETIRKCIRDAEDATNRHDFSSKSIPWCTSAVARHNIETLVAGEPHVMTIHEVLEMWSSVAEEYPGWRIRIVDEMVMVDDRNGFAEAFLNLETHNVPSGVIKPAVVKMVWKLSEGDWVITSVRQLDGLEGS